MNKKNAEFDLNKCEENTTPQHIDVPILKETQSDRLETTPQVSGRENECERQLLSSCNIHQRLPASAWA